jgi:gas vesicle protein
MAKNKLLVGVLIGAAAGAAIGYLLTTNKGKEILSNIQDYAGSAGERVKGMYDTAKSKVSDTLNKGRQYAEEATGKGKQYAEEARNNM